MMMTMIAGTVIALTIMMYGAVLMFRGAFARSGGTGRIVMGVVAITVAPVGFFVPFIF